MRESALSVANFFIQKSLDEEKPIQPLKLMKLVYIAHGYMLAFLDRSPIEFPYDCVEAWQYGPVIPSVYYSFKQYGNQPINELTSVFVHEDAKNDQFIVKTKTPELTTKDYKDVCGAVWKAYSKYSASGLVAVLHAPGTPWEQIYVKDMNRIIPDSITMAHYKMIIRRLKEDKRQDNG